MWQGWVNGILGLWLILSGIISGLQHPVNYIIVGVVVAALGFWSATQRWQGWVDGVLGLWLIVSGIITTLMLPVNSIVVGLVVAVMSFWEALGGKPVTKAA